jgi:hypothetical protein
MDVSVVVPIRCDASCRGHAALAESLGILRSHGADVVVVDGSDDSSFARHRHIFSAARHLQVTRSEEGVNGKVTGISAGVGVASFERVVLADDDVVYDPATLAAVSRLLDHADLVVPQNFFVGPSPWHATWDTARTVVNRAFGRDYPGTMAVRRSTFLRIGGYDDDVLFENLELMRTIEAAGGRVLSAPGLFVPRLAPSAETFVSQRVRQAYDDLAQPARLLIEASALPLVAWVSRRRPSLLVPIALAMMGVAEVGRRRAGGRSRFPATAAVIAPLWALERSLCVWVAVGARVFRGGIRYRGGRLRRAASSPRSLRRRSSPGRSPRGSRRTRASAVTARSGRVAPPVDGPRSRDRPRRSTASAHAPGVDLRGTQRS